MREVMDMMKVLYCHIQVLHFFLWGQGVEREKCVKVKNSYILIQYKMGSFWQSR